MDLVSLDDMYDLYDFVWPVGFVICFRLSPPPQAPIRVRGLDGFGLVLVVATILSRYHRHVMLPKETAKVLPKSRLLSEDEWRNLGVQQSRGWQHYAIHR